MISDHCGKMRQPFSNHNTKGTDAMLDSMDVIAYGILLGAMVYTWARAYEIGDHNP